MNQYARPLADRLKAWKHDVTWITAPCSGHCCGPTSEYVGAAFLEWVAALLLGASALRRTVRVRG
jgi:hypothetical protein